MFDPDKVSNSRTSQPFLPLSLLMKGGKCGKHNEFNGKVEDSGIKVKISNLFMGFKSF